jgi:hypothetical protein
MSTEPVRSITRTATGRPLTELPYDPALAPEGPRRGEWDRCQAFLQKLSGIGVQHADEFVMTHRDLKYGAVHQFFGTICPDPMLSGTRPKPKRKPGEPKATRAQKRAAKRAQKESPAEKERRLMRERRAALGLVRTRTVEQQIADPHEDDLPNSLPDALNEFTQLEESHQSRPLTALAQHIQRELGLCEGCEAPRLPAWADRNRMLLGQRAFMTNLLPAVLVLLCKSLSEAYSAGRPAAVLMLSGELSDLPYHRLIGTMQLLVTVSTPYSFEGPWYPAFVAAEEMQLLHAGVRMNVAPRLATPQTQPVERAHGGWTGQNYQVWPGYEAFTRGWPKSDHASSRQVVVSQTDMLATIIAFSVLVIDGLKTFGTPMTDEEADAYWHLWRVFAVLKGIHPPGRPHDGSWVPETLADARDFWQTYRGLYLCGPDSRTGNWEEKARVDNPAGCALTSAHCHMIAKMLKKWLRYAPVSEARWLRIVRWYVELLSGEEGAARVGVPASQLGRFWRWVAWTLPKKLEHALDRLDPNLHIAVSSYALVSLVNQEYGTRLVFPVPQTLEDLTQDNQSSIREKLAARVRRVFTASDA